MPRRELLAARAEFALTGLDRTGLDQTGKGCAAGDMTDSTRALIIRFITSIASGTDSPTTSRSETQVGHVDAMAIACTT